MLKFEISKIYSKSEKSITQSYQTLEFWQLVNLKLTKLQLNLQYILLMKISYAISS